MIVTLLLLITYSPMFGNRFIVKILNKNINQVTRYKSSEIKTSINNFQLTKNYDKNKLQLYKDSSSM